MTTDRIGGRWIEDGAVRFANCGGGLHRVVDFEDDALRAVLAVPFLIPAAYDREAIHDVVDGGPRRGKVRGELPELLSALVVGTTFGSSRTKPATPIIGR